MLHRKKIHHQKLQYRQTVSPILYRPNQNSIVYEVVAILIKLDIN